MTFSLNEVEATAKKAARGAGYSWGLAEEAGKAVRWLCAQGVDGCAALAGLLAKIDGIPLAKFAPDTDVTPWRAQADALCPITTGCVLSDRAAQLAQNTFQTGPITSPALLFPFAAYAAVGNGCITLTWPSGYAVTDGENLSLRGQLELTCKRIDVSRSGTLENANQACTRAAPDPSVWQALNRFAHRTYAPATDASRLKGAG